MTSLVERARVRDLVQIELAAATGQPAELFIDDAPLSDLSVDSISLVEALIGVREQLLVDLGRSADEVSDPPALPWIETVGDLISFVSTSVEDLGGSPNGAQK
jgi:acyl carrier protein